MFPRSVARLCRSAAPPRPPTLRHNLSTFYGQSKPLPAPGISRPLVFSVGVSSVAFAAAAYWTNRDTERVQDAVKKTGGIWRPGRGSEQELHVFRLKEVYRRAKSFIAAFPRDWRLPTILVENYMDLSEAQRTCLGILVVNGLVFMSWKFTALNGVTRWYFLHDPLSPTRTFSMLGSVFSHQALVHFAFNSIALWSFGYAAAEWMGTKGSGLEAMRSTSRYEFLAFFVAAGLLSSLTSHLWSVRVLIPRLLKASVEPRTSIMPSLGASGAIYGCLVVTALAYPETSIALIFLPFVPIKIGTALFASVALDASGLIFGWRLFDHAAHLGGALAGWLYFYYGHGYFEKFRIWLQGGPKDGSKSRVVTVR